jgi:Tfp pilus assembly protein PilO
MTNASEKRKISLRAPWSRRVPRRNVLIVLGVFLALDLLFYLFAVRPLDAREQEQRVMLETLQQQVEQKQKDVERLKLIVSKVAKARAEGDALLEDVTFLRRTTFSDLMAELIESAKQAGIDTREGNFDAEPIEGSDDYGILSLTANFRGEYESLVKFVNRLDRSKRFLIVGSLGATPRSDSTELQITMTIDTFVRGFEATSGL